MSRSWPGKSVREEWSSCRESMCKGHEAGESMAQSESTNCSNGWSAEVMRSGRGSGREEAEIKNKKEKEEKEKGKEE